MNLGFWIFCIIVALVIGFIAIVRKWAKDDKKFLEEEKQRAEQELQKSKESYARFIESEEYAMIMRYVENNYYNKPNGFDLEIGEKSIGKLKFENFRLSGYTRKEFGEYLVKEFQKIYPSDKYDIHFYISSPPITESIIYVRIKEEPPKIF